MKRFAIAAAVLALFSVSIAIAQRQDAVPPQSASKPFQPGPAQEPDARTVSGVFSVLKIGDWASLNDSSGQVILRVRSTIPEGIRETVARLDELRKGGRGRPSIETVRIEEEFRKAFGGHPLSFHEVEQVSSEYVVLSNDRQTIHVPSSAIGYIARNKDKPAETN